MKDLSKLLLAKENTKKELREINSKKRIHIPGAPKIIESKKYKQKYKPDYKDLVYFI